MSNKINYDNLEVFGTYVIAKQRVEETTKTGIIIAPVAQHAQDIVDVLCAGPETGLKKGDAVMVAKFTGTPIDEDDRTILITLDDVIAKVKE